MSPPAPPTFDAFVLSLDQDEATPIATPMLRSIRHGLRGEWDAAHELAQAQDDAVGAWAALRQTARQEAVRGKRTISGLGSVQFLDIGGFF